MNALHSIIFGCVFTASVLMSHCKSQATSTQSTEALPDNFIGFDSVPDKVVDGSVVRVRYQCSRPCRLGVEVVVSALRKTDLVVFRRKWISSVPQVNRIHQVPLRLPPSISYQPDFFNRNILDMQSMTVRAFLDYFKNGTELSTYRRSVLRVYKVLQIMPLSERPSKPPTECLSWWAQLMWQLTDDRIHQCPHESDIIDLLKFPLASTGEHFGVVRRLQPFIDGALERARLHAVTQPSVALSVWVYLLKRCHRKLCGIVHRIDRKKSYDSILLQLTDTGNIVVQARMTTGKDGAFLINVALPLWKWIRLDCFIQHSKVLLDTTWDDETRRHECHFQDSIHYDDTDGYFVIGGGKYIPGIHGYFGPIKYYRFGTAQTDNPLHPKSTLQELEKTHQECQEIKAFTKAFCKEVAENRSLSPNNKGVCTSDFYPLWGQLKDRKKTCSQTWTWKLQQQFSTLYHLLQTKEEIIQTGSLGVKQLGRLLFELAVAELFSVERTQMSITSQSMASLQVSSCFGNHRASLLLASIHLAGLGRPANQQQAHVYSLIGAAHDDRFALMHVGYKHSQGIDGFPEDLDMAYSYYSNVGSQSGVDASRIHESKQYLPEHIYLENKEDLERMTQDEASDVFQYLKYEAERGNMEAQKRIGTMLQWGQNGIPKDLERAMKWLERSAMQMRDPTAMYDYSVLMIQGKGVKRNRTRGFRLLEKAAKMGSINALNGLGWYHGTILNDHKNATKYFEKAASSGNVDAMFNLGLYHLTGKIPGKPWANESAAFRLFLNASRFGHVAASVEAAWYLSTGSLEGVSRDVQRAVIILKKVCEQNGHLGFMIRGALQAYLQGSWQEAFVKYVLAAETGLGLAQSNTAHLCEELNLSYDCQWRYHNYSILNYDPHPSALLKMGDHYYYYSSSAQEDSLSLAERAISMYSRAALAGSPQGMYNLVALAHQGHILPPSVLRSFNVSQRDEQEAVMEKILKRCAEIEEGEGASPCSLALLGLQTRKALRSVTQNRAQLALAYASLLSVFVIIVVVPVQSCLEHRGGVIAHGAQTLGHGGVDLNREQDGISGRPFRAAGNLRLTALNGRRWLRQTCDLAVTLSGLCFFAFWTTVLYHFL
ncbi:protein sel-1 homolog 3 isoform X2 [Salarias fasciatus]|uniref:protein sel-1 homolog 3 isoform X2 n=1 Tax=Salarias fasciatus TaxID=181472 RepID=UPI0011769E68|nr:protein sel-1 homolog 3-like isoform X2 [Salarias fasciatus]